MKCYVAVVALYFYVTMLFVVKGCSISIQLHWRRTHVHYFIFATKNKSAIILESTV